MAIKMFVTALTLVALAVSVPAATVSVQVVESGLPTDATVPEASSAWEAGLLDVCFDAGHIVSNAPILRVPENWSPDDATLAAAREGGADFLILALLEYDPALAGHTSADGSAVRRSPLRVICRLLAVHPRRQIAEKTLADLEASSSGAVDQGRARDLAQPLLQVMKDR